jgi:drug/metabolite transporter (DMT)-like permease
VAAVVVSQTAGLILLLLALPLLPETIVNPIDIAWGAVAGLAGGSGVALLYRALALGPMSLVAPLTAVFAAAVPVFTGLALGERLSMVTTLGIALAAIAIVLIGQEQGSVPRSQTQQATARGITLSIVAGLLVGVFFVSLERTSAASGLWPLVPARLVAISLFAGSALAGGRPVLVPRSVAGVAVGAGALDMLANALFLIAVQQGPLSVVATLASLYPASTIILARIVLGERWSRLQAAGIATAVAATTMIVGGIP